MASVPVINPEILGPSDFEGRTLSERQVAQWRDEGFLLVDGVFSGDAVHAALDDITRFQMSKQGTNDFEVGDGKTFPTKLSNLDALSISPRLLTAIEQLLGTTDIRMSQAETWKKVGLVFQPGEDNTFSNQDQRMHMDYPNHTLVHPPRWETPEAVAVIIYLSDCKDCGGATRLVPRLPAPAVDELYQWPYVNMPGFGEIPWKNDRDTVESYLREHYPEIAASREKLYAREQSITFSPGTVLFYRHDLWHRGTPLIPGSERFVQNLVFKRAHCHWLNNWNRGTAYSMYDRTLYVEKLIARSTVQQRHCLGFPAPGSPFWTPDTVEAVRRRYESLGMDMTPYIDGMVNK